MWEKQLETMLFAIGNNPTKDQIERLESWCLANVPSASFEQIAYLLPVDLATEFSMRSGELGVY